MTTATHPGTFGDVDVELVRLPGGVTEIRSRRTPSVAPPSTLHWLHQWASTTPSAVLLSEVVDGRRQFFDYADVWARVSRAVLSLQSLGVGPGDRIAVIAANGIDSFVSGHAAMLLGALWVPIAPQYLRAGADPARIRGVLELIEPSIVIVPDKAFDLAVLDGYLVVHELSAPSSVDQEDIERLLAGCRGNNQAKLLLTSGSTGTPKAVVYTHRMLVSNARVTADVWPFVTDHAPVLVDWLPWNHAFGGNQNINMVLLGGGTIHIDESRGRPTELARSIAAITEFAPTFHAAVPATFQALLPVLEVNRTFRTALLGHCDALFSAGAAMPAATFHRLRALSESVRPEPVPVLTGWGSTEVGPGATIVQTPSSEPGWIGPPLPGVTVRLVPTAAKQELRVRGPSVMPGYWRDPVRTAAVFDDDGFYRSGDAGRLVDEQRPELGLRFDGRVADDFKLANGSWVNVERLRVSLLACAGTGVRDVVVAGPDRSYLVALFWLWPGASVDVQAVLADHNSATSGQTNVIVAASVLDAEPADELLSPKGLIKPAAFRAAETARIDSLYGTAPGTGVGE